MNAITGDGTQGLLDASPMSRPQVFVVCVAVLLSALDGFDVLGMAYVAPAIGAEWQLSKAVLGFLLSTSLIGMAIGSLTLSPLADIFGRKPAAFGGVSLMLLGSLLSAISQTVPQLAACRILTGVGIGVMVPLTTTIAAEFASAKGRAFAVTSTTVGFTAGSVLGSFVAAVLLQHFSWHSVFVSGAVAGVLLLPVIAWGLPESPSFLISRRGPKALEQLNVVLARLNRPVLHALPAAAPARRASYRALFGSDMRVMTCSFAAVMVLVATTNYYLLNWLPQMIADAGYTPSTGSLVSAVSSTVAMISGLSFGFAATRFGPVRLGSFAMIGLGCAVVIFGFTPPTLHLLLLSVSLVGIFAGGASSLFYATLAQSFPPLTRVTGIGFVTGFGRVFSVSGPAVAGVMFAAGLNRQGVSVIFGCLPILAGILLVIGARRAAKLSANAAT